MDCSFSEHLSAPAPVPWLRLPLPLSSSHPPRARCLAYSAVRTFLLAPLAVVAVTNGFGCSPLSDLSRRMTRHGLRLRTRSAPRRADARRRLVPRRCRLSLAAAPLFSHGDSAEAFCQSLTMLALERKRTIPGFAGKQRSGAGCEYAVFSSRCFSPCEDRRPRARSYRAAGRGLVRRSGRGTRASGDLPSLRRRAAAPASSLQDVGSRPESGLLQARRQSREHFRERSRSAARHSPTSAVCESSGEDRGPTALRARVGARRPDCPSLPHAPALSSSSRVSSRGT
ncbi:hypothetical protein DMC30DRAFT_13325 [Rhodotorula diobovata]|uniref:Uncharacterized protein n=1 Tax=Rhodotorula diobovata TaxID=5288 RepID=A0A5C5FR66_9BASI|nr:hypothetical protein DMC30DRAFT_13325 [Rhodotorula diobovata]